MKWCLIANNKVIDVMDNPQYNSYPPLYDGSIVTLLQCPDNVMVDMLYNKDSGEFYKEEVVVDNYKEKLMANLDYLVMLNS